MPPLTNFLTGNTFLICLQHTFNSMIVFWVYIVFLNGMLFVTMCSTWLILAFTFFPITGMHIWFQNMFKTYILQIYWISFLRLNYYETFNVNARRLKMNASYEKIYWCVNASPADEKFDLSSTKLDAVLSLFMRQRRCVTAVDGKNDVTPLEFPFCRTVRKYLPRK